MPLKGIKVVEMAGLAPGPFCGMVLADFGASVIRVDKIGGALSHDCLGSGKRSIALDLKTDQGVEVLKRLTIQSDVIIDPFRRGVMEKLKLGPNDLMPENKKLIYARLTGYGQDGPFADRAGHDINYLSLSGLLSLFGRYKENLVPPTNLASDFGGGGLMCALGIVLALFERSRTQLGQVIDANMVEGTAYLGSWLFRSQKVPGIWGQPRGKNLLDTGAHFYNTYETKDGKYISVGAIEPQFYAILLEKLNLKEDDFPHFYNFDESRVKFTKIFKNKTQKEWSEIFDGSDACVTPVLSLDEVKDHPHNKVRRTFTLDNEEALVPKPAPGLSRTPGISSATKGPAPDHGEHSIEILSEHGFTTAEMDKLVTSGIVFSVKKPSKL